jgi:hypothetical protein
VEDGEWDLKGKALTARQKRYYVPTDALLRDNRRAVTIITRIIEAVAGERREKRGSMFLDKRKNGPLQTSAMNTHGWKFGYGGIPWYLHKSIMASSPGTDGRKKGYRLSSRLFALPHRIGQNASCAPSSLTCFAA